jgi:lipopolysaccharide transport system ATP-binding protein
MFVMSSEAPIVFESISKCYRIYSNPKDRLKQALADRLHLLRSNPAGSAPTYYREHWALRDVTFELGQGESIGILGRNGAGKSTLLQIVAGTLEPSSGRVATKGRITALLELGSGFNPDFTGRENVLLNAQILGLTPEQALDRFDEIAAFADIGDFIEQPVKTYSSGMMMRLAFAVQTAVDPKVLVVDEALAVGDMFFQAKCIARIKKLLDSGVSLLYVSHDPGTVRQLCNRALLIQEGRVKALGEARAVADEYAALQMTERNQAAKATRATQRTAGVTVTPDESPEKVGAGQTATRSPTAAQGADSDCFKTIDINRAAFTDRLAHHRTGTLEAEILNVQMLRNGSVRTEFDFKEEVTIRVFVHFKSQLDNLNLSIQIRNRQGLGLIFYDLRLQEEMHHIYQQGKTYCFDWSVALPLMCEHYHLQVVLAHPPTVPGDDWVFVDNIPNAYDFFVSAVPGLPISSYIALPAQVQIMSS